MKSTREKPVINQFVKPQKEAPLHERYHKLIQSK